MKVTHQFFYYGVFFLGYLWLSYKNHTSFWVWILDSNSCIIVEVAVIHSPYVEYFILLGLFW